MTSPDAASDQLRVLERRIRGLQLCVAAVVAGWIVSVVIANPVAQQTTSVLRAQGLIIEDASGRARIALGAPIPGENRTTNQRTGLRINDADGVERFGLALFEDGRVGLGFDAPPGTGDDRNRERITIFADQNGGAYIRFLDRRTSVAARMHLDEQNQVWMEFSDFTRKPPVRRRFGLTGEEEISAVK